MLAYGPFCDRDRRRANPPLPPIGRLVSAGDSRRGRKPIRKDCTGRIALASPDIDRIRQRAQQRRGCGKNRAQRREARRWEQRVARRVVDRTLRCYCDSGRCRGSSHQFRHRQRCHLWEPACRRRHPALLLRLRSLPRQLPPVLPSPAMPAVGAGMPATAPSAAAATPVAAMAAPTSSAIASDAICGSRHAGDCNLRYCRDPSRCHGSSHSGKALSWPAMPAVGAGMPATAPSATAATPVAAMAAPTSAATASHLICGSRHAGDGGTADRHSRCCSGFRGQRFELLHPGCRLHA